MVRSPSIQRPQNVNHPDNASGRVVLPHQVRHEQVAYSTARARIGYASQGSDLLDGEGAVGEYAQDLGASIPQASWAWPKSVVAKYLPDEEPVIEQLLEVPAME